MTKVFFESDKHSELIAIFENEETYLKLLPSLENLAREQKMYVTESVEEDSINSLYVIHK